MGPGIETSGRLGGQHRWPAWPRFGGAGRLRRQGPRRPARRGLPPRPPGRRRGLRRRRRRPSGPATGRCLIVVTPDAERTMSTYLGAGADIGPERRRRRADRRRHGRCTSRATCGTSPAAKEAYREASRIAHEAGREVALTLSDAFCVDRHRDEWVDLVAGRRRRPVRQRGRDAMLYDGAVRRRGQACRSARRSLADHPRRRAARWSSPATYVRRGARRARRAPRRHDRRRRLYAAGFLFGFTRA